MPPVAGETASSATVQVAERWAAIDPLLPLPSLPSGCGTDLVVTGAAGAALAVGACEHWVGEPGSMDLTWGAARRFRLTPQVAGPCHPLSGPVASVPSAPAVALPLHLEERGPQDEPRGRVLSGCVTAAR